uniref:Condensin complex subunit 2 n=1 Tax=Schizaphis graminum TaxID=13262 RepID=A0A2S2NN22_SCHGA
MNKLDYIVTHFNQETSQFCANNSEGVDDLMEVDLSESNSGILTNTDPESSNHNNKTFGRLDNLNSLSQTLLMVDTTNSSDYTFFNRKKMCYFKCTNHWNEKFKMMINDSKQKAMLIKSRITQTPQLQSQSNVTEFQCNKSKEVQFKVDFYSDNSTILKNIKLNSGKNQCNYIKWKPRNNLIVSSEQSNISPIRQLESCKYIHIIPNWYKKEFEELNLNTNPNTLFLFPEQNILSNNLLLNEVPVENTDYIDQNFMDIECENEEEEITTEEYPSSNSGYIDMHKLKKYIMSTIKPDGEKTINISFADLLLKLPKFLPENMKKNISVSVIYVALLHLCNEYSLRLESKNDEILISQSSLNNEVLE